MKTICATCFQRIEQPVDHIPPVCPDCAKRWLHNHYTVSKDSIYSLTLREVKMNDSKWLCFLIAACVACFAFLAGVGFGYWLGLHSPVKPLIEAQHSIDYGTHPQQPPFAI